MDKYMYVLKTYVYNDHNKDHIFNNLLSLNDFIDSNDPFDIYTICMFFQSLYMFSQSALFYETETGQRTEYKLYPLCNNIYCT